MITQWFGDRSFWRSALRLAIPIALQNLLLSSFHLVDTMMIGRLGEVSLAAVGMAGQWSWLMGLVMFGFTSGASVFLAQYWGAKDENGVCMSFGVLTISTSVAAGLFLLVAQAAPGTVLGIFSPDAAVIAEGAAYLRCASFAYVATAVSQSFSALLRSTERAKLPMYGSCVAVVLNIALNALFIYGLKMGVAGAGIATSISAFSAPATVLVLARRDKNHNLLVPALKRLFRLESGFARRFYRVSLPVLANEALWALGTVGFNVLYGNLDTGFYAAVTIFKSVEGICYVFFIGLCHSCAVMVGKSVGRGDFDAAVTEARRFTVAMIAVSLCVGAALIAARPLIMLAFDVSAPVNTAAQRIMLVYAMVMWLLNIPYVLIVGVFRAGGDTRIGLKLDIIFLWLVSLPVTILSALWLKLPLTWVFLIMFVSENLGKAIVCVIWYAKRKWLMPVTGPGA